MNIPLYLEKKSALIERALLRYLPRTKGSSLHEAMRYAVMGGGKRVRPALVLAACEVVGGRTAQALPAACAIEFIHNYSLIHDDLPCMDNDAERRGQPTCHKKFGETTALLAGDALLTLAFEILAERPAAGGVSVERRLEVLKDIAAAAGVHGMVGGQAVDMDYQGKEPDLATLEYINTKKTGALIAVSLKAGALLGGGTPKQINALYGYGKNLGLLFQIVDDILDGEGYAKVMGAEEAKSTAERLLLKAIRQLENLGPKAAVLGSLADFVHKRSY